MKNQRSIQIYSHTYNVEANHFGDSEPGTSMIAGDVEKLTPEANHFGDSEPGTSMMAGDILFLS